MNVHQHHNYSTRLKGKLKRQTCLISSGNEQLTTCDSAGKDLQNIEETHLISTEVSHGGVTDPQDVSETCVTNTGLCGDVLRDGSCVANTGLCGDVLRDGSAVLSGDLKNCFSGDKNKHENDVRKCVLTDDHVIESVYSFDSHIEVIILRKVTSSEDISADSQTTQQSSEISQSSAHVSELSPLIMQHTVVNNSDQPALLTDKVSDRSYDIFDFETDSDSQIETVIKCKENHANVSQTSNGVSTESVSTAGKLSLSKENFLKPKLHRSKVEGEIHFVRVGQELKKFLGNHSMVKRLYLNRGKRDMKKNLVYVKRQENAVDKGAWKRAGNLHQRNRLDDMFEATEEGKAKKSQIVEKTVRDEYVVNWYLWCPGHGNCLRKCGGFGTCVQGCKGASHKQDRHNCSVLINLKLFLSDLSTWRVHIIGSHVPVDTNVLWQPPVGNKQRIDEDMRDIIVSFSDKASSSEIVDILSCRRTLCGPNDAPSKKRISCFVSGMKKRRRERVYYDESENLIKDDQNETGEETQMELCTDDMVNCVQNSAELSRIVVVNHEEVVSEETTSEDRTTCGLNNVHCDSEDCSNVMILSVDQEQ